MLCAFENGSQTIVGSCPFGCINNFHQFVGLVGILQNGLETCLPSNFARSFNFGFVFARLTSRIFCFLFNIGCSFSQNHDIAEISKNIDISLPRIPEFLDFVLLLGEGFAVFRNSCLNLRNGFHDADSRQQIVEFLLLTRVQFVAWSNNNRSTGLFLLFVHLLDHLEKGIQFLLLIFSDRCSSRTCGRITRINIGFFGSRDHSSQLVALLCISENGSEGVLILGFSLFCGSDDNL
ncbi:MAG: hypothetical protein HOA16_05510 [Opitutae bacterium]|nr:hypothetical protein [Opitutae bacterium]